jgi:glycerol-3-phosphate dehydrogenase
MSDQPRKVKQVGKCAGDGKVMYLSTAGGKITCLRCTAESTRTKQQCGRPAIKTSRTQKCQFHGGRPHTKETLKRISEANTLHGEATKEAKEHYRHSIELIHELQDAMYVLNMGSGPKIRGPKPRGYKPVMTQADVARMIRERLLHRM